MVTVLQIWSVTYLHWVTEWLMIADLGSTYLSEGRKKLKTVGLDHWLSALSPLLVLTVEYSHPYRFHLFDVYVEFFMVP